MRELTGHKVNGVNDGLTVSALDEPGHGNACHKYAINVPTATVFIDFQNGPIAEASVNGITHEALLAILIDRLEGFQSGPYQCEENCDALFHCRRAMRALLTRTEKRLRRGVEGTHQV